MLIIFFTTFLKDNFVLFPAEILKMGLSILCCKPKEVSGSISSLDQKMAFGMVNILNRESSLVLCVLCSCCFNSYVQVIQVFRP